MVFAVCPASVQTYINPQVEECNYTAIMALQKTFKRILEKDPCILNANKSIKPTYVICKR
jgi:hypothetical protein